MGFLPLRSGLSKRGGSTRERGQSMAARVLPERDMMERELKAAERENF